MTHYDFKNNKLCPNFTLKQRKNGNQCDFLKSKIEYSKGFNLSGNFPNSMKITEKNKKKYFKIKKFIRYDQIFKQLNETTNDQSQEKDSCNEKRNRKESNNEKLDKMKTLSKIIRRYKRKIKIFSQKFKAKMEKIFRNKIKKLISKQIQNKSNVNVTLENLVKSLKKLKENKFIEYSHERTLVIQLINLIASRKLKPNSIHFKKICTQVRHYLNSEQIIHISQSNPKIHLENEHKSLNISNLEYIGIKDIPLSFEEIKLIFGFEQKTEEVHEILNINPPEYCIESPELDSFLRNDNPNDFNHDFHQIFMNLPF